MFTQRMSGSQSENSSVAGKKISMYEKWMSKGPLFKRDPAKDNRQTGGAHLFPTANRAQSLCNYPLAARKEKDDRELLQQVVTIIQECNNEVKSTLGAVKDKLDSQSDLPAEKTTETLTAFLQDIWKHEERMLQAVEKSNSNTGKIADLEKQIALKDAEIQQLQNQAKGQDKQDLRLVAKAIRQEMLSPQVAMENKLQEILEMTRDTSEQQCHQLDQYKQHMTACTRQHSEWKTASQKLIKDTEKRLQKEISSLRSSLQQQEEVWQTRLRKQMSEVSTAHLADIERLLHQILSTPCKTSDVAGRSDTATKTAIAGLKKEMQATLQKQVKTVERSVHELLGQQLQHQQDQLNTLQTSLMADIANCVHTAVQRQTEEAATPLTLPQFEEKFVEYHQDLKKQLEDMHYKHVQDVIKLQQEMKSQESSLNTQLMPVTRSHDLFTRDVLGESHQLNTCYQNQTHLSRSTPLKTHESRVVPSVPQPATRTGDVRIADKSSTMCQPFTAYQFTTDPKPPFTRHTAGGSIPAGKTYTAKGVGYGLQAGKGLGRISPMSKEEKANLFTKAKPSPVTVVLPQKQPAKLPAQNTSIIVPSQVASRGQTSLLTSSARNLNSSMAGKSYCDITGPKAWKQDTSPARKKQKGRGRHRKSSTGKSVKRLQQAHHIAVGTPMVKRSSLQSPGDARDIASKMAVYNFTESQSPDVGLRKLDTFQSPRSQICSPSQASDTSRLSSPAMSITEVVVVRRSRWQSSTRARVQQLTNTHTRNVDALDMLSTPYLETATSLQHLRQQLCQANEGDTRVTRSGSKRKR